MDMLIIFIAGFIIALFVFGSRSAPPPIVYYLPAVEPRERGTGCLPAFLGIILLVMLAGLLLAAI